MKIAYLLESTAISGGAKVAIEQARGLALRGHSVTIVSPEPEPEWISISPAAFELSLFARSSAIAAARIAVATFWTTVEPALARTRGTVFHLCQGYEAGFSFYAGRRTQIEEAYRLPTRKLVVAPHLADRLARAGVNGAVCVGQTFEADEFHVDGRRFDRAVPRVLLPGMIQGDVKGVAEALEALAALRRDGARFTLVRVSTEPPASEESAIGVTDEYHRELPPRRMPRLLASADLFVGPSHPEEGFDLPALEALAAGLPCALSDTPAHRHTAGDEAVFFEPRSPGAIAEAVGRLLAGERLRRALSNAGPGRAAAFRTRDVIDRLERVFGESASRG